MDKPGIVALLDRMADALEIAGANPFEILAYRNGARNLDEWSGDVAAAVRDGTLTQIDGIGKGLAAVISDLVLRDRSEAYERLCERVPASLVELLAVPGLGPRKVRTFHERLGVRDLDDLERAARAGRIRELDGFAAKSEQRILGGIERARRSGGRRR